MKLRAIVLHCLVVIILAFLFIAADPGFSPGAFSGTGGRKPQAKSFEEARARLSAGLNAGDIKACRQARDLFLGAFLEATADASRYEYHIALADFRITAFAFRSGATSEAESMIMEGQRYLDSAISKDPGFGEAFALRAYLRGFEIAIHPERAMGLGEAVFQDFGRAEELEPENPRVFLLKGSYLLYVPPAYGGGPDSALPDLLKAEGLFAGEKPAKPLAPDWGKDEVYLYLGLAHKQKGDPVRAGEMFRKALAVNPDFGWAKGELAALGES